MKTQIKFFGTLAEATGKSNMDINEFSDTDSLIKKITADFPILKSYRYLLSVNRKLVNSNQKIEPDSEVAFLPAFSGG